MGLYKHTERDENKRIIWTGDSTLLDGEWETGSGLLIQSAHTHLDTQGHFSISSPLLFSDVSYSKYCFYLFRFFFFFLFLRIDESRDSCRCSPIKWMQLPVTCIFHTTRTGVLCIVHITRFGHENENFFYLCFSFFFSFWEGGGRSAQVYTLQLYTAPVLSSSDIVEKNGRQVGEDWAPPHVLTLGSNAGPVFSLPSRKRRRRTTRGWICISFQSYQTSCSWPPFIATQSLRCCCCVG